MCGISGYIRNHRLDETFIEGMAKSLHHRGPDNTSFFRDEIICLGHNRLKIIDLSENGNQPFLSADSKHVMIYNGEIYNFQELAVKYGITQRTKCDTEVVLELYIRLGDDFVHELNGMFAMAIYNKESGELKCWRDQMGIKPFYYYWDGQSFAFASELKALLTLPFSREMDQSAISDYLFLEYIPQPKTPFKNFYKLGNGFQVSYLKGQLLLRRYYHLLDKVKPGSQVTKEKALENFEALFQESLKYRMIADVKVGAFLSGGTDSSAVVSGMAQLSNQVSTFNIGFKEKDYDESEFASEVARKLKTDHHHYQLGLSDLLDDKDGLFRLYDEPFAVSSIFPTYKVSQLAKKNVTVALSGDGGDELFMGYGHYNWHQRIASNPLLKNSVTRNIIASGLQLFSPRLQRAGRVLAFDKLHHDWPHIWSQEQYMFSENEISRLTGQRYFNEALRADWEKIQSVANDPFQAISLYDLTHYLPDDLLYKVDLASMANSLEVRVPFLDHRLVEYVVNLPTSLKKNSGDQKILLKKHLEKRLPRHLIYRKKWGFGAPVEKWLQQELKGALEEIIAISKDEFDQKEIRKLIHRFQRGQWIEFKKIWALYTFLQWSRNYSA